MRPAVQLIATSAGFLLLALGVAFWEPGRGVFLFLAVAVGFVVLLDLISVFLLGKVTFERKWPARFALKQETEVGYRLQNLGRVPLRLRFFEGLPEECHYQDLPFDLPKLAPQQHLHSHYRVLFLQRGDLPIAPAYLVVKSLLGFWWQSRRVGEPTIAKVYPNYLPALNYGLLATADRAAVMGIVKPRHRGMSKEFHQLRDYHKGDSLSQMDWKATSRFDRLITREYQEERDQTILLVPDCSLRTRAIDGELPLLDHLLNAAILLSSIALGQGDKVGVMSFGGEDRFLPPAKGPAAMARILEHLYSYQADRSYGDYADLVSRILHLQTKRCLVVVLTNLRTEDQFGSWGVLQLLTRQHLVLLASVRETAVDRALVNPLITRQDASRYLGALAYQEDIESLILEARSRGFHALHESLERFPIALANQFLDLRSSGCF